MADRGGGSSSQRRILSLCRIRWIQIHARQPAHFLLAIFSYPCVWPSYYNSIKYCFKKITPKPNEQERPYHCDSTASRLLSEVKHSRARLVLRWGTTLESLVLFFCFSLLLFFTPFGEISDRFVRNRIDSDRNRIDYEGQTPSRLRVHTGGTLDRYADYLEVGGWRPTRWWSRRRRTTTSSSD